MKLTVKTEVEIEPVAIKIAAAVRYDEEDMPNDFPGRIGDVWHAIIDIETGKIRDWPQGKTAKFYMKVCDQGSYWLLTKAGHIIASIEGNYVPSCIPGEYGDYIDFDIAEDGTVRKWSRYCDPSSIRESFYPED